MAKEEYPVGIGVIESRCGAVKNVACMKDIEFYRKKYGCAPPVEFF